MNFIEKLHASCKRIERLKKCTNYTTHGIPHPCLEHNLAQKKTWFCAVIHILNISAVLGLEFKTASRYETWA
jgi:hypothetical protein